MKYLLLFLISFNVLAIDNPLVISNVSDQVYNGSEITNNVPGGVCLQIINSHRLTFRNLHIHDCPGRAVHISGNSDNITIVNSDIVNTGGIVAYGGEGFFFQDNRISKVIGSTAAGVTPAIQTSGIQLVLAHSTNIGSIISGNDIYNNIGDSFKIDGINIYKSNFSETRPLIITDNNLFGYGQHLSGGGIVLDLGNSYVKVVRNYLDHAGSINIRIVSGHHNTIEGNTILHEKTSQGGIGISAYSTGSTGDYDCHHIYIYNNISRVRAPEGFVKDIYADPATCFQQNDDSRNINNITQGDTLQ